MSFVIRATQDDRFEMDGQLEDLLGTHLLKIMKRKGIYEEAWSESHALAILAEYNVKVTLLDEYGESMEY